MEWFWLIISVLIIVVQMGLFAIIGILAFMVLIGMLISIYHIIFSKKYRQEYIKDYNKKHNEDHYNDYFKHSRKIAVILSILFGIFTAITFFIWQYNGIVTLGAYLGITVVITAFIYFVSNRWIKQKAHNYHLHK